MLIRWATESDLPAWYALATEVSPIFRHPTDMGKDPEFVSYAKSKAGKNEALTAVDYVSGSNMGFIGFSRTNNRITWFGVSDRYRCRGVGSRLLKIALRQLDPMKPITVETFPEGYAPGIPAKSLYRKFGFVETESDLIGPHDLPICKMTADLSADAKGAGCVMNNDFHIRVTGILLDHGKILIVKQKLSDKRTWSLPGGRLEHGESLEQAAIREMYEETGIIAQVERLLYICDVKPMNQVIHITFLMTCVKGDICLPVNSHDENPISDVIFADIECLTDYGFSEKFIALIMDGFPGQGSYMGDKSTIGLEV